jgi:hypothetical protein
MSLIGIGIEQNGPIELLDSRPIITLLEAGRSLFEIEIEGLPFVLRFGLWPCRYCGTRSQDQKRDNQRRQNSFSHFPPPQSRILISGHHREFLEAPDLLEIKTSGLFYAFFSEKSIYCGGLVYYHGVAQWDECSIPENRIFV